MFVPKFVYEKAPFYWIILGVLLIVTGTYYGKAGDPVYFFAGIGGGAIACVWGFVVFGRRLSRESSERQTSCFDPITGMPWEVPVPRKVNFISQHSIVMRTK